MRDVTCVHICLTCTVLLYCWFDLIKLYNSTLNRFHDNYSSPWDVHFSIALILFEIVQGTDHFISFQKWFKWPCQELWRDYKQLLHAALKYSLLSTKSTYFIHLLIQAIALIIDGNKFKNNCVIVNQMKRSCGNSRKKVEILDGMSLMTFYKLR